MSEKDMKEININADIWTRLHILRGELKNKKWSATIGWLLDQVSKGETMPDIQEPDHEKILQDIIGSEVWSQVQEMMFSHNLDISGVLRHLLSCHSLLEKEEPHRKLEGKEVLEEIYDHIQQLQPSQKLKEKSASSEASTVDIAPVSEERDHTDGTCKTEWLCCPVCYSIKPLIVEVDPAGHPLKKHENGIKFKKLNGVLQRRFIGPDDNYLPIQTRIGDRIIVEESMAISVMRRLDKNLFDDFTNTLKNTTHKFTGGMW